MLRDNPQAQFDNFVKTIDIIPVINIEADLKVVTKIPKMSNDFDTVVIFPNFS